jgi:hypothetical protein
MAEHLVLEIPERAEVDHVPIAASCWTGQDFDGRRGRLDSGV